jgi:hypothetical protein
VSAGQNKRAICGLRQRGGLLRAKLPEVLSPEQKAHKLKNLLQAMRRGGLVHTRGPRARALWLPGPASLAAGLDKAASRSASKPDEGR